MAMGTHTKEQEVFSGTHQFTIAGFSLEKTKGIRNPVRSGAFEVGGYSWKILCYPAGKEERGRGYVSAYLEVVRPAGDKFKLKFCITIIGPGGKRQPIVYSWWNRWAESASDANELSWGSYHAISLRSVESGCLVDDRLTLSCTVHVQKLEASTASRSIVKVPPPGISQDVARLLESELGSDVTFQVDSNHYHAHKAVVATRSPVFAAQFFGPLADGSGGRCVRIHDMAPAAFEAVLHFIYTDTLPPPVNDDESVSASCTEVGEIMAAGHSAERRRDMVCDWLAAADRYGLERMRLLCESVLWETIHVANAAATLEIADRHHCQQLKSFCIDYIASPKVLPGVLATDGYKELKLNCPLLVADILEKLGSVC
ncbi:BTB/POZ and MATH domain-containing protein 1-like [Triticum aestivum]|nr:BTB/POZ and MATH domain-containing protein 1-like [Triticum aestivum]